jgi:hypothetical protein
MRIEIVEGRCLPPRSGETACESLPKSGIILRTQPDTPGPQGFTYELATDGQNRARGMSNDFMRHRSLEMRHSAKVSVPYTHDN